MGRKLFRKWGKNVKGRDWYDMEWYIRRGTSLNLEHFLLRAKDSGDWQKETMTEEEFLKLLNDRIETVNLETAKNDAKRFISDPKTLDIWTKNYFKDLIKNLNIK